MSAITVNDVRHAVMATLKANFPDAKVYGEEIKQGFTEPAFFVKVLNTTHSKELDRRYRRVQFFDVHYFDRTNEALHAAAEKLYDVLEYLNVLDGVIRGTGMRHEIVDGVLHFFVEYGMHLLRPREEGVKMKDLDVEGMLSG